MTNLSDTIIAMAEHDGRGYSARHTTVLTIPRFGLLGALSIERRAKAFVHRGRGRSRLGYVRTVLRPGFETSGWAYLGRQL